MQLVTTVYSIEGSERATASHLLRGCREETALATGQTQLPNQDSCAQEASTHDGFEIDCFLPEKRCWIVVPPALVEAESTLVKCEFFGLDASARFRILVHHDSQVLLEKELSNEDIRHGEIVVEVPAMEEGIATFVLIGEQEEKTATVLCTVPCCVVPSSIAQDIHKMLNTMMAISKEREEEMDWSPYEALQATLTPEQKVKMWVWTEYFTTFLGDVELLFEWMESNREQVGLVMEVFVNVLEHCCLYEAWNFGAHLLNKAQDCGLEILSNQLPTTGYITPEELKSKTCEKETDKAQMTTEEGHEVKVSNPEI